MIRSMVRWVAVRFAIYMAAALFAAAAFMFGAAIYSIVMVPQ